MLDFTTLSHTELQKLTRRLIVAALILFIVGGALGINFIGGIAKGTEGGFKTSWQDTFQPILVNLMSSAVGVLVAAWLFSLRAVKPREDGSPTEGLAQKLETMNSELNRLRSLLEKDREAKFTTEEMLQFLAVFTHKDKVSSNNLKAVSKNFSAALNAAASTITNGKSNAKNKSDS